MFEPWLYRHARWGSLSHREREGVRGYGLSIALKPPHPNPLPAGEREHTEIAAPSSSLKTYDGPGRRGLSLTSQGASRGE